MDGNQTFSFQDFLATQTPHIGVLDFSLNLAIATVLSFILSTAYVYFGTSLANRRLFARNLVLIAMTTMLIITVVKSSLALSLGLVGALSIIRFRTPIKDPEELAFLFISIAIGLGMGAGQRIISALGFAFILAVIWLRHKRRSPKNDQGMHLTVTMENPDDGLLDRIVGVLSANADSVELRRVEESNESFQGDFMVSFEDYDTFSRSRNALREVDERLRISFMDNTLI